MVTKPKPAPPSSGPSDPTEAGEAEEATTEASADTAQVINLVRIIILGWLWLWWQERELGLILAFLDSENCRDRLSKAGDDKLW